MWKEEKLFIPMEPCKSLVGCSRAPVPLPAGSSQAPSTPALLLALPAVGRRKRRNRCTCYLVCVGVVSASLQLWGRCCRHGGTVLQGIRLSSA